MDIKVHVTYYMQIDGTTRVAVRKIEENGIDEVEIEDENGEMHRVWQKGSGMDITERCPLEKGLEGECGLKAVIRRLEAKLKRVTDALEAALAQWATYADEGRRSCLYPDLGEWTRDEDAAYNKARAALKGVNRE